MSDLINNPVSGTFVLFYLAPNHSLLSRNRPLKTTKSFPWEEQEPTKPLQIRERFSQI
jgi:hypothetical protein